MSALRAAFRVERHRRHGRVLPVVLSAFSMALALPSIGWADDDGVPVVADDDLAFSTLAVGDEMLDQTRGTGAGVSQVILLEDDEADDGGLSQTVDIGSFNSLSGFNNGNAVATAIIQQDVVQIIGSGGVHGNTGN